MFLTVFDNCQCQKLFLTRQFKLVKYSVKNYWCRKPYNSVFAMRVFTRDFTMFLPAGKNTFGHGNKWQKVNFGNGWVLSTVF